MFFTSARTDTRFEYVGERPDLFSSGMWSAIMVSGSLHSTIQPFRSLTRDTSGSRKWLGMRLQITGVSICTSSRGGHWGTGFFLSL